MPVVQDACADHVRHESGRGDPEQQPGVYLGRIPESVVRLDRDADGDCDQGRPVHQRRQDLEPEQAECALGGGGALREGGDHERQGQRPNVRKHVTRVREQRQRAGEPAPDQLHHHDRRRDLERHGHSPPALGPERRAVGTLGFERERCRHGRHETSDLRHQILFHSLTCDE